MHNSTPLTRIVAVDRTGRHEFVQWAEWARGKDIILTVIIGDSHAESTAEQVARSAAPVDFLFIDGDHTQDGFQRDFEKYWPMVAKGGACALHDIRDNPARPTIGSSMLWKMIKESGIKTDEFIVQYGTGVAYKEDK